MKKTFWFSIVLAILLVIFSVQNADIVTVKFFFDQWTVDISIAILLICVFIFGAITGSSFFFIWRMKERQKEKALQKMHETQAVINDEPTE